MRRPKSVFLKELEADAEGIGFAYGGVEPGRLRAHGNLVEWHRVYYSIGVCGSYRLHVGLRATHTPLPGSPFRLDVAPGPAPRRWQPSPLFHMYHRRQYIYLFGDLLQIESVCQHTRLLLLYNILAYYLAPSNN